MPSNPGPRSTRPRFIPAFLWLLLFPVSSHAQQSDLTLHVEARLVTLSAVVQDKKGGPIAGLTKDDFVLRQDGRIQPIRYFSGGSDLPLTLALMVDVSGSERDLVGQETIASQVFFRAMLTRSEDQATLIRFGHDVLRVQAMTPSVDRLETALDHLTDPYPANEPHDRGGTLFYDAVFATADLLRGQTHGRRAMVILTDGEDHRSQHSLDDAIAEAQDTNAVVYSVLYTTRKSGISLSSHKHGDFATGREPSGRDILRQLSKETGGRAYEVTSRTPLSTIFNQIAEDLRSQYEFGYTPPQSAPRTYHKIELKPLRKGLIVDARKGYLTR